MSLPYFQLGDGWVVGLGCTVGVAFAYFLAARLGLALLAEEVAVFWPASGIAVGILVTLGRRVRAAVVIGVIVATIVANLMGDRSLWTSVFKGFCDAGEAVLTAWLIERWFGSAFSFHDVRHVLGFAAAAALGAAASGVGGAATMTLLHTTAPFWDVWRTWFLSDGVGILVVAPLVIGLCQLWHERPSRSEWIEGLGALALVCLTGWYVVGQPSESWVSFSPSALVFPFLLWLAARLPPPFGIAGAFAVSVAVMLATTFGMGRFGDASVAITERFKGAQAAMTVVTLYTLMLTALFAERRRNEAVLKESERRFRLTAAELDHRVKNVLAQVAVVAVSTRQGSGSIDEFLRSLNGRIQSMAAAHTLLSKSGWQSVGLDALVRSQLAPYATNTNITIRGTDIMLTAAEIQAVARVLHELVTNAAKHGALSMPGGHVSVNWDRKPNGDGANLMLVWQEHGGPPVKSEVQSSYGTNLIRNLIPHELGGKIDLVLASEGVSCRIEIPIRQA